METADDTRVIEAIRIYGGDFARALAAAAKRADSTNLARIRAAFPELWELYREIAAAHVSVLPAGSRASAGADRSPERILGFLGLAVEQVELFHFRFVDYAKLALVCVSEEVGTAIERQEP